LTDVVPGKVFKKIEQNETDQGQLLIPHTRNRESMENYRLFGVIAILCPIAGLFLNINYPTYGWVYIGIGLFAILISAGIFFMIADIHERITGDKKRKEAD
jgi:hypothetical protein